MILNDKVSPISKPYPYRNPYNEIKDTLMDYEMAGDVLYVKPSSRKQRIYHAFLRGRTITLVTEGRLDLPLLDVEDLTRFSLTFDDKMYPALTYTVKDVIGEEKSYLWFYNHTTAEYNTRVLTDVTTPYLTFSPYKTNNGLTGIMLGFIRISDYMLCMSYQNENFNTAHVLRQLTVKHQLIKFGMSSQLKYQFEIRNYD